MVQGTGLSCFGCEKKKKRSGYSYGTRTLTCIILLFIRESFEYAQYSYLFMAAPVRSAGICYSYGTLFTDFLRAVFSSYVFYSLSLVPLFVSFVSHVIV